jgi:thiol-disulfide isomerase/thioredoxin
MSKSLRVIIAYCIVCILIGSACSKETSDVGEATAKTQTPQTTNKTNADAAVETELDSEAAVAYAALMAKVQGMEKSTPPAQMRQALAEIEVGFKEFIDRYPESIEAADIHFQLGILYGQTNRYKEAISHLAEFVGRNPGSRDEKAGYAHYYLAEAYKGVDDLDKAEKHYKKIVSDFSQLNPRFIAAATASVRDLDTLRQLKIGGDPIAFNVKDTKGKDLSLEQYKGKVVLLDFWATWCGPCKVEMPNVIRLHKKYKEKGFDIIGISLDQNESAMKSYVQSNRMDWRQYFDGRGWQNGVAMKYKVRSIPATYLIDRKGKIRYRSLRGKQLEAAVEELINET